MFKGYILSFLLIGSILSSDAASYEYRYPGFNETDDDVDWGGKCEIGNKQSPIEIISEDAIRVHLHDLKYENYDEVELGSAQVVNNGHTIHIHNFSTTLTVTGGIVANKRYILDQLHFHWPTEHVIDNKRYSLEMHLVHHEDDYLNIAEALKYNEGVLVLAVLFKAGHEHHENPAINSILQNKMIESIDDNTDINKNFQINGNFKMRDLMPAELDDNYFSYMGSLTTPPCTESVRWIVFNDLQRCSLEQVKIFDDIEDQNGDKIPHNSRSLQKTNRRNVYYVMDDEAENDDKEGINKVDSNDDVPDAVRLTKVEKPKAKKDDDDDDDKDKDGHKDDKDDDKNDDDDNTSSSLRYSGSPITILIALILTAIGAFKL